MPGHANNEDLEQYVTGQLSADDSELVRSHLVECEQCRLKLVEITKTPSWTGPEKRDEPRMQVSFPGHLKMLDPVTSSSPPHDVQVIEISSTGLKIRTPRFLIPKTLVQVRFNGKAVLGEVRHCVKTDTGYHAGIQRVEDFPSE